MNQTGHHSWKPKLVIPPKKVFVSIIQTIYHTYLVSVWITQSGFHTILVYISIPQKGITPSGIQLIPQKGITPNGSISITQKGYHTKRCMFITRNGVQITYPRQVSHQNVYLSIAQGEYPTNNGVH